jgi:hypothetical protein
MIKINSSYKYLLFFFTLIALIFFSETSNSADADDRNPECAAVIVPNGIVCEVTPTTQKIIVYKVAFCTTLPTAPTSTTAIGMTSCSTVFENTAGATITIEKGVGKTPDGKITDPPYGTYTYAYVELSPVLTYKASLVFNNTKALSSTTGVGANAGFTNCQTNGTNNFYWDTLRGITCQAEVVAATDATSTINSFDNNNPLYGGTLTDGTNIGTTHLYLIKTDGTLATNTANPAAAGRSVIGNVAKLIFFIPMTTNITPDTTSFNLLYNNTRGMVVWQNLNTGGNGTFFNIGFSAAYFDMTFQIQ